MSYQGERLRFVLAWKKMKGAALGRKLNLKHSTRQVQGWMNGLHAPGAASRKRIAAVLRIDERYLHEPLVVTRENELLLMDAAFAAGPSRRERQGGGTLLERLARESPELLRLLARASDAEFARVRELAQAQLGRLRETPASYGRRQGRAVAEAAPAYGRKQRRG